MLARSVWRSRLLIVIVSLAFAIIGVVIALLQTPVYRAKVVFALVAPPFSDQSSGVGGLSSLGGALGKIAGLNLSGAGSDFTVNLEILKSRELARDFLAAKGLTNRLAEASQRSWLGSGKKDPRPDDGIDYFRQKVRSITPTTNPVVMQLEVEWPDAQETAAWANALVDFANNQLRSDAATRGERRLQFLRERMRSENVVQIQDAFSRLIAEEMKSLALTANVDAYAFRVIDPAFVPLKRAKPQRTLIVILAGLFGFAAAVVFVLARDSVTGKLDA